MLYFSYFFAGETNEVDQRIKFVGLVGLYILHFQIFRISDKRVFKTLWDMHKKVEDFSNLTCFKHNYMHIYFLLEIDMIS